MNVKTVIVAADIDASLDDRARGDARFRVIRRPVRTESELVEVVGDAHVLATRAYNKVTRRVLDAAPQLELIVQGTSGIDNVDLQAARERGIRVIHLPGVNANAVAELVIGFIIAMTRTVPFYTRTMTRGEWTRDDCADRHELRHSRLGIIGLGNVGTLVAKYAGTFGMTVHAYDPYVAEARVATLDELLANSDILTMHVPLTHETRKMVSAAEIAKLRQGSYLINASRGEVLDQHAALEALRTHHLAGLALDVFDPEPPAGGFPDDPRLILTPHVGGCSHEVKSTVGGKLFEKVAEFYGPPVPSPRVRGEG
jgi:D-3-phosphoglycerate dehydrogenase